MPATWLSLFEAVFPWSGALSDSMASLNALDRGVGVRAVVDGAQCVLDIASPALSSVGSVSLDFSGVGVDHLDAEEVDLLVTMAGITVGQACMAEELRLGAQLHPKSRPVIDRLARLHYDAHAYAQRLPAWAHPKIVADTCSSRTPQSRPRSDEPGEQRVVLLWSGGKDALASLRVLRANGYDIIGLHATVNDAVRDLEAKAARDLASQERLPLLELSMNWPVLTEVLDRWSSSTGVFPLKNPVAHGRDLLLHVSAAIAARRHGAGLVAAGYEYDLWAKCIPYRRRVVYKHDTQSRHAGQLIDELLSSRLGVGFFSPISSITESVILAWLLAEEADAWPFIVSCFWGDWCGECRKCLRYALRQQALDLPRIDFRVDPLGPSNAALDALVDSILDSATPYWEQQLSDLFTVYSKGLLLNEDACVVLSEFESWYSSVSLGLSNHLRKIRKADLAPPGFEPQREGRMMRYAV